MKNPVMKGEILVPLFLQTEKGISWIDSEFFEDLISSIFDDGYKDLFETN